MLRKERLEAEVVRLRATLHVEHSTAREHQVVHDSLQRRCSELEQEVAGERAAAVALEQQLIRLGHMPCIEMDSAKRRRTDAGSAARGASGGAGGGAGGGGRGGNEGYAGPRKSRLAVLGQAAVRGVKRQADGSWAETPAPGKRPRGP
eukprot:257206-Rhodomonas_salina.2